MSRRKILLLFSATLALIAATYVVAAVRSRTATTTSSKPAIGVDESAAGLHMKSTDELIAFWKARFERDPHDFISLTYLGQTYLRKGRETGDVSEYQKAEAVFRQALTIDANYEPTLAYLSASLFVKHDFAGALEVASRVYSTDPRALQALATIGDAQLELGNYPQAQAAYQTLLQKSPTAPVYSRSARLAWLEGRPKDALALMQEAVDDSNRKALSGENAAWYDFQLGELYFNTGQLQPAETEYAAALKQFDNYYLALAGLGKVRAAQSRYTEAIGFYEKAVAIIPQPDLLAALGDLYTVTGDAVNAKREYDTVQFIGKLQAINQVIYNRQLALFDANHDRNVDEGLNLARNELQNRKDIYAYDTYAWALYKNRMYADALAAMQQAMKLGTRDAMLAYHAGMIYKALGDEGQAQAMLTQAMAINPHFDLLQARIASAALLEVEAHASQDRWIEDYLPWRPR